MMHIRKSQDRGHVNHGWLDTHHTFSFANYYDPEFMGFRTLRVINEDRVAPGEGFGTHPHRDMEIITCVLEGELEHKDSLGNGSRIRPGDIQRMSAGTGVLHSEFNASKTDPVHLLQIWILPEKQNAEPGYEQKNFPREERLNRLRLVASRDGREGSVRVHQSAELYASLLEPGKTASVEVRTERYAWVQVARGTVEVFGQTLEAGDGAAFAEVRKLELVSTGSGEAEFLVFILG